MTTETRYLDILNAIVGGPYYDPQGNILPFRSGLTTLQLLTEFPNTQFLITINGVQSGIIITDANGNATFGIQLPLGELLLEFQRENSTDTIRSYFTVRETAVWHAALAEQFELIDDSIDSTLNSFYLAQAGSVDIELAHGVLLRYSNEAQAELEAYREILQLVRQSTRQFTGRLSGKFGIVSALTQINPIILNRTKSGPRWILDYDQLFDDLQSSSRFLSSPLTNINASGQFVTLVSVDDYINIGSGTLIFHKNLSAFIWTPPIAATLNIDSTLRYETNFPAVDAQITVPAGRARAFIDSQFISPIAGGFVQTENEHLYIELDDVGTILDINLFLNGDLYNSGALTLDTIINGYFRSRAPYNQKRRVLSQPAVLLASVVEVVNVSDSTATGTATLQTTVAPNRIRYTAPGDSVGPYVLSNLTGELTRIYSGNGIDYVDIFTIIPSASTDTFVISERYLAPASLVASGDILRIRSQNEHSVDGPSKVTIHDGGSNAASHPLLGSDKRGYFVIPEIDTTLSAAVTTNDTSIQVPSNSIDGFNIVDGINNFPFDVIIGYGLKSTTTSFSITASSNSHFATVTTGSPFFAVGDIYVTLFMDSSISATRNIGSHKIITIQDSQNVVIAYNGFRVPQPGLSGLSGVSTIGVHQNSIGSGGVLNYFFATTTMSWTAPSDSAGTAINVSAGGYFRLFSNNGIEHIDILVDASALPVGSDQNEIFTIDKFETVATSSNSDTLSTWSSGERAKVISITPGSPDVWNLQSPVIGNYNSGQTVYLANDMLPLNEVGEDSFGDLVLDIDVSEIPAAITASDTITTSGSVLPDGWLFTGQSTPKPTIYITPEAKYRKGAIFFSSANPVSIDKELPLPDIALGSLFTLKVYIRNVEPVNSTSVDFRLGFDFGSGFVYSGNFLISDGDVTIRHPFLMEFSQILPTSATKFRIQIDRVTDGVDFILERVIVFQTNTHGIFLGNNTIPRNESRSNFGSLMYIWSPDILTQNELTLLGIDESITLPSGTFNGGSPVDGRIAESINAHEEFDVFDVSDVVGSNIVNVRGTITDLDWNNASLTNMEIVARTPRRFSFIKPSIINFQDEILTFSSGAPYKATLSIISDQNQNNAFLYEDDIPVPQNEWQFNTNTEIEVTTGFNVNAIYRFEYQALIQVETQPIDIVVPSDNGNDTWLADYVAWNRHTTSASILRNEISIIFDANLRAILPQRSDINKLQSVLVENTGINRRIIPQQAWDYIDSLNIRISGAEFNVNAIYTFEYNQQITTIDRAAIISAEIRSASSIFSLSSATYNEFLIYENNAVDSSLRYHQIKLTISNISTLDDVRIHSATLRGLRLNTNPLAPGL
jgi:hypothetical protein